MCSFAPRKTKATKGWKVLIRRGSAFYTAFYQERIRPNYPLTAKIEMVNDPREKKIDYGLSAFCHKKDAVQYIQKIYARRPFAYFIVPVTVPENEPKLRGKYFLSATDENSVDTIISNKQFIGTPIQITKGLLHRYKKIL